MKRTKHPRNRHVAPTLGACLFALATGINAAEPRTTTLKIGQGQDWHFTSGAWTEDGQGVIRPPDKRNLHSRAFSLKDAYGDVTVEFEYNGDYRETGTGNAGLILRAADVNHCYVVRFPWGGQQLRAKHFWAALAKIDGDAYQRNAAMEWVPGVPSETDRWYSVRVEAKGPRFRVWVDGRRALDVTDGTFKQGRIGLAGYGWYAFRNIRVEGQPVTPPTWDASATIPTHTYHVGLSSEQMPSGCVAPNGDVLLAAGRQLVRSKDKGQTFAEPETLPEKLGTITDYGNTLFRAAGRLVVQIWRDRETTGKDVPAIEISESTDNGKTWSDPVPATVATGWPAQPRKLVPYGPMLQTDDGAWIRFLLGGVREEGAVYTDVRSWGAIHAKAYAVRGEDGGKSWSGPIELDRPSWSGVPRGQLPGSLDFTEPTGVAFGQTITALIRPVYSPYMWQCWSYDGGKTWDAASRATFPGYAQSMVRTASGAILCGHRYPQYQVNVSRDDGVHWDAGTVIDYPAWAMGCMVEVDPDVVLCTYMNAQRSLPLVAQRLRVSDEGLRPLPVGTK